jgi:KaiC/GvpD/RAD55 family RecA-like ATPase
MAFKSVNDVKYVKTPRLSTNISELDWIYGGEEKTWGLPKGMISLWSGPAGCGKSRSLITLSREMSRVGNKVIYFQNEVNESSFRGWMGAGRLPPTFYVSEETELEKQLKDIEDSGANLAIIDSISQMKEFKTGAEMNVKHIYKRYRDMCKRTGVHVIFICQLNSQYKIKGSSEILYLADISVDLDRHFVGKKIVKNHFTIGINGRNGGKHRYGQMGDDITTLWKYSKYGAECLSGNRDYDEPWCEAHGISQKVKNSSELVIEAKAPKGYIGSPMVDPISGLTFFDADPNYRGKRGKLVCM